MYIQLNKKDNLPAARGSHDAFLFLTLTYGIVIMIHAEVVPQLVSYRRSCLSLRC
jgi:hypothetical protein